MGKSPIQEPQSLATTDVVFGQPWFKLEPLLFPLPLPKFTILVNLLLRIRYFFNALV